MAVDTLQKKRSSLTDFMPFYLAGIDVVTQADKQEGAWGYSGILAGGAVLTATFSDLVIISDLDSKVVGKGLVEIIVMSDSIVKVIPSWLRRLRVQDTEYYIIIKRIR